MKKLALIVSLIGIVLITSKYLWKRSDEGNVSQSQKSIFESKIETGVNEIVNSDETISNDVGINLEIPVEQKILNNNYHVYQTFNNCGPAALSMALSYYDINVSQKTLGQELRPFQNPVGDNDDKSVTLEELVEKSKDYNFIPFHRPNGNTEIIKYSITHDIPVIVKTWLKPNEDIGHYRIVKGYDEITLEIIQDDSMQGKNIRFSYTTFEQIWKKYNYEYLLLVPKSKVEVVKTFLGENAEEQKSWELATINAKKELQKNPNDVDSRFNLVVALYNIKDYKNAVIEYEKIESKLSPRTLWYQIEPIRAYYELGNYEKVFSISDQVLNNGNAAYSELYILRGNIYLSWGNESLARTEFNKALYYNKNLESAKNALTFLDSQ